MIYVADTHAFLWHLAEDKRLGRAARAIFQSAEQGDAVIVLPAIAVAECLMVIEKKHLDLQFAALLEKLRVGLNFTILPLDLRVLWRAAQLAGLPELHDRIIVASADLLGAPLLTRDRAISASRYVQTIW